MRAGREASSHGSTVFVGSSGSCGAVRGVWRDLPGGYGAVWGRRGHGGALVATAAGRRQSGGSPNGRTPPIGVGGGASAAAVTYRRGAGPDAARDPGRAGRARGVGQL